MRLENLRYKAQLEKNKKAIEKKLSIQEDKVDNMRTADSDFMDEYKKLNLLRLDLKTIESRIENVGNYPEGLDVSGLSFNQQIQNTL